MAGKANTFETGVATGTTITTANSDDGTAGDAFDTVVETLGGTAQFSTVQAQDTRSGRFRTTGSTTDAAYVRWNTALTEWYWRMYVHQAVENTLVVRLLTALDASNDRLFSVVIRANRADVRLLDNADAEAASTTTNPPLDDWYRLEGRCRHSATTGLLQLRYFGDPTSDTPDEEISATNIDTGAASALAQIRWGVPFATAGQNDIYLDNIAYSDAGWIGSGAEPPPPSGGFPIGMLPL